MVLEIYVDMYIPEIAQMCTNKQAHPTSRGKRQALHAVLVPYQAVTHRENLKLTSLFLFLFFLYHCPLVPLPTLLIQATTLAPYTRASPLSLPRHLCRVQL
jgi:hypothetical protein